MMTSPKKAKAKPRKAFSDWDTPRITGLLVLADGTVIEGQGFGAEGEAVGEVCFNTAMTGYQEVLTDPSYAGQIVTFTFPHIGNVGTNDDDLETTNLAASAAVKGCVVKAPVTDPANYRSHKHFDKWLKTKGIIGLSGVDTRELTNLIRDKGMPNGVIAHNAKGKFDVKKLLAMAKAWGGLEGLDLAKDVSLTQRMEWDEKEWDWTTGYTTAVGGKYKVVAIDYGLKRNILRCLTSVGCDVTVVPANASAPGYSGHEPRWHLPVQRPRRSRRHRRIRRARNPEAHRQRQAHLRHLPRPPDAGPGAWRQDQEDAPGPPRRQSPRAGFHHRQGRDHLA